MFRTITPVISIILAVLLFMFFVQPEYNEVKTLRKDRDDYRDATAKYQAFSKKLQEKIDQKSSINTSDTERLTEFVPSEIDSTKLLVKLEKTAKKHNMLFGNIKADDAAGKDILSKPKAGEEQGAKDEKLMSSDISFSVIGTYAQFKDFLSDLEQSLTLFEIVEIELTGAGETQFQQFSLTVRTYALSSGNN